MADAIQGLSIGLGLDTAGIDQSLKQLKGKLSLVNSEMKNNMSAFDRGEKSLGKYETQLTGLNKKLELQKSATAAAKTEYDKMVATHGEGSVQADKAAKAYNDQSASLNNLERHVGDLTDEFKAFQNEQDVTNSKFGKLSESMEKMGAKMSAAGDKMKSVGTGMTKAITAPIVGIGVAAFAAANDFDKASNTIRAGTGATGDALADLEASFKTVFKTVPEDAETVSGALADINTRTGLAGVPLEDLTKKFLDLSRITGEDVSTSIADMTRTFGTWDVAAEDSGSTMDYLWKVAQTTGIGVADLTADLDKMGPTFQNLGYNMEESAALLGQWEKSGANSEVMLVGLRKGMQNLADAGKDPQKVLPGLIKQIESAGTESEAMGIAMELFGKKAGPEMALAIRDGALGVDELMATLDGSGETIGAAAEETMSLADQFVLLKNNTMAALEPIGTIMLDLAKQYLPPLIEAVGKVAEKFEGMSDKTQKMVLVFGGIAAAIGPVLVVAGSLISMFGGMMTALAPLLLKISQAGGLFKYLRVALAAFTGPVGIAVAIIAGLTIGFIALYKNSETFRDMIGSLIEKVKELASQALAALKPAIETVVGFFKDQLSVIKGFWDENSATIMAALSNIGGFVSKVFNGIMAVIQFVMPAVLALISAVWENIKGVITGALDIIMGAVKVFSGLFSGDFSKMWEGIKQMFSGAITFLWNFISLTFFGKVLGGAKLFVGAFKGVFTSLWAGLKTLFTGALNGIKNGMSSAWGSISSMTTKVFTGIWNFLKNIFTNVLNFIVNTVTTIFTRVVTGWTNIFNRTSSIFSSIWNFIKGIFTKIRDYISQTVGNILSKVTGTWTTLKNTTSRIFGDIFTGIKNRFTDIVNAAKALPQRIGDGIGSMASKVKSGVTKVINNLASTLGKGVNGVIGGINWVLGKIGVSDKNFIDKWPVPQYAKGTKGHEGGLAVVGDGKGSNAGSELIKTPDGEMSLSPSTDTLMNLPKGTQVFSAKQTREYMASIPHYKNGVGNALSNLWEDTKGVAGKAWEGTKAIGGKVKDAVVDAFDYIKKPGAFLDLALKTLGINKPEGGNFAGNMAVGAWDKTKSGAIDFVKNKLKDFGSTQSGISVGGGSSGNFGAPFRFTSGYGPRNTGIPGASTFHKGYDWAAPTGTPIPSVTDGIGYRTGFHRLSGNFVEVKSGNKIHRYQHNSKNIMRVGQQVKKGQTVGLVGSTGVGSGAHLHYETRGLETGGIVNKEQLVRVGEKNRQEIMIPMHPSRRTDAMKLLALAGKKLMPGGDKGITRPNQLPNVGGGSNNDSVLKSLLAATMKQNEILMQLLNKDNNLYVDGDALAGAIGDPIDSRLGNSSRNNMYMNGVR